MGNKIMITLTVSSDDMDVILNALEEKALNVNALRENLYQEALVQVQQAQQERAEREHLEIEQNQGTKKEGRKSKQMENIKLICKDCGKEFDFTVGEQKFYEEKGFAQPIRCKECRDAKKARNLNMETGAPGNDFEAMLKRFQENTIKFED